MHACGHDAHTAMALATAAVLAKEAPALSGNLFFVFQPAEELAVGAAAMLRDGVLDGVRPDAALAVHVVTSGRQAPSPSATGPPWPPRTS